MQRPVPGSAIIFLAMLLAGGPLKAGDPASLAPLPPDPLERPTEILPMAAESLLLDITRSGERIIAIGERGHVLISSDGKSWTQSSAVPLRSTLTAVTAVGNDVWAVGHDGVILHSANAGDQWEVQRREPRSENDESGTDDVRQGAPLLDVLFTDATHGIAIGAYSLYLTTSDGGKSWSGSGIPTSGEARKDKPEAKAEESDETDETNETEHTENDLQSSVFSASELKIGLEENPHLNAIARTGSGHFVIVGERGAVFRSTDGGASWNRSQLPYDGSMFGIVGFEGEHVLAFGLRGHVFESRDLGANWTEVPTGSELSLMAGTALADGGAVIVGANGIILHRSRDSDPLTISTMDSAGVIAGVLPLGVNGELLVVSENGIGHFQRK